MTINEAKDELNSVLLDGNVPILFLGAGFSIGARSKNALLDKKGLSGLIFERLIEGKVPKSDYKEILEYNLRDLCNEVYSLYQGKKELYELFASNCRF